MLVVVLSSGCAHRYARLETSKDLVVTKRADAQCGPVGVRRTSLGARWGEYVRVWVTSANPIRGEARLHVDGRAYPLQRFSTGSEVQPLVHLAGDGVTVALPAVLPLQQVTTQAIVLDATWTNERLDVPAALGAGHVIDVTLAGLETSGGSCADVVFTVEQGVFQPNVDERAWIAELTRRGGPELQAWLAAEAARQEQVRREHEALHAQRRVQWEAERQARAAAFRIEVEARIEADRQAALARVEAERRDAAAQAEAARLEATRREAVRQAHFAEHERRREARLEAMLAGASVVSMPAATGDRGATSAQVVTQSGASAGVSVAGSVASTTSTSVDSTTASAGVSVAGSVASTTSTSVDSTTASAGVSVAGSVASTTSTSAGSTTGGAGASTTVNLESNASVSVESGATSGPFVSQPGTSVGGSASTGSAQLDAVVVSRESVSPSSASEWVTPEFGAPAPAAPDRVVVNTQQVTPPPCGSCQAPAPRVQVVDPTPALIFLDVLGAIFNVAANVQVQPRVHAAVPAPAQPARPAPPPPPARPGGWPPPGAPR